MKTLTIINEIRQYLNQRTLFIWIEQCVFELFTFLLLVAQFLMKLMMPFTFVLAE